MEEDCLEEEWSRDSNKRHHPAAGIITLLMGLMLVALIYLVILGHDILDKVQTTTTTTTRTRTTPSPTLSLSSARQGILPNINMGNGKVLFSSSHSSTVVSGDDENENDNKDNKDDDEKTTTLHWKENFGTSLVILVVFVGNDQGQLAMATKVAEGAQSVGGDDIVVVVEDVAHATFEQVLQADAVILGSPVENGNTHPAIQTWINDHWNIQHYDLSHKVGGAFVTAGGMAAGLESTLHSLTSAMLIFRMIVVGGDTWTAPFGASAVTAEAPYMGLSGKRDQHNLDFNEACYQHQDQVIHPMFLKKAYGLGQRVAKVAFQLQPCK